MTCKTSAVLNVSNMRDTAGFFCSLVLRAFITVWKIKSNDWCRLCERVGSYNRSPLVWLGPHHWGGAAALWLTPQGLHMGRSYEERKHIINTCQRGCFIINIPVRFLIKMHHGWFSWNKSETLKGLKRTLKADFILNSLLKMIIWMSMKTKTPVKKFGIYFNMLASEESESFCICFTL